MANESCPVCGAPPSVTSLGAFGWLACCSACYDEDPEAPSWTHMQGIGETHERAVESWLVTAREFCAIDEIPPLRISYALNFMWRDLAIQIIDESERQESWVDEWALEGGRITEHRYGPEQSC